MTVLQILNSVLRRLRETEVSSLEESEYSSLVADFIVDVHDELLQHEWSSMEHVVDVPVDASQHILDLSQTEADGGDVDNSSTVPSVASVIYWAKVFDSSSDTNGTPLSIVSSAFIEDQYQSARDTTSESPCYISFRASPDRDGLEAMVWPPAEGTKHIRVFMWTPEDSIDTSTDTNRVLLVPDRPVRLGALYLALNERGEELGEPGGIAERRYTNAVSIALEADMNRRANTGRYTAERI